MLYIGSCVEDLFNKASELHSVNAELKPNEMKIFRKEIT